MKTLTHILISKRISKRMTWFLPHIMEGPINRSLEASNRSMHILQGRKPSDEITSWQVIHHLIGHFKLLATRMISTTTLRINIWQTLIESMVGQATLNSDIPIQLRYRFHHRIIMLTGILSSQISLRRNEVNKKRYHFSISKKLWTATFGTLVGYNETSATFGISPPVWRSDDDVFALK